MNDDLEKLFSAIDSAPWPRIEHAFDPATDVPDLIRGPISPGVDVRNDAWSKLHGMHLAPRDDTRQLAMRCLSSWSGSGIGVAPAARDAWPARRPRFSRSLVYRAILRGRSSAYGAAPVAGQKAWVPTEIGAGVSLGSGHQRHFFLPARQQGAKNSRPPTEVSRRSISAPPPVQSNYAACIIFFIRSFMSCGETSSMCVATPHRCPNGS